MFNNFIEFCMKMYGEREGEEVEESMDLVKELFWSGIRASLYKKVHKEKDSYYQWAYINGKESRYSDGTRITLSEKNLVHFQKIVDYLNSEEGLDWMHEHDIYDAPPEDVDTLVEIVANAMVDRQIKKEIFNLFMKNRHDILKFLQR